MTRESLQGFGLEVLTDSHPELKSLKRQYPTTSHGDRFWGASFLLIDYLRKNPVSSESRILEIGSGWALAGIYANKQYDCHVTAMDVDPDVIPYAKLHAKINEASIDPWQNGFEDITETQLADFDVLIAADVCFWYKLSTIQFALIKRALEAGVSKIIYSDPERAPFTVLCRRCEEELKSTSINVEVTNTRVKSLGASGK